MGRRRSPKGKARSLGSHPNGTFPVARYVLVVIRTVTTLNRLLDVWPALFPDPRLSVKFVIDKGSRYARDLPAYLRGEDIEVITWREARARRWDLILAAHANQNLRKLRGPLMIIPHGAGHCRILPSSTGSRHAPVGIARGQIAWRKKVIPAAIGLSHESQMAQVAAWCPEAVRRAYVIGDPTFDRIVANRLLREEFRALLGVGDRRVAVVSSTWGEFSSAGKARELAHRLVAQLPADEWLVILVFHPNVWCGDSTRWELVNSHFVDARDGGALIMKPQNGWQTALLAADVVIGDHGSVSFYGAALGVPFRLSATGLEELDPSSPRVLLSQITPRLDVHGDLLAQIESAIAKHDPVLNKKITDHTLGEQGRSLQLLRAKFYELLRLPPPNKPSRMRPLPKPDYYQGPQQTSHLVAVDVTNESPTSGTARLKRFPAIVSEYRAAAAPADLPLVVLDTEVDAAQLQSAEIIVHERPVGPDEMERWHRETARQYPGCALTSISDGMHCVLRWRDGRFFRVTPVTRRGAEPGVSDAYLAAAAFYGWVVRRGEFPRTSVMIRIRLGAAEIEVRIGPAGVQPL